MRHSDHCIRKTVPHQPTLAAPSYLAEEGRN